MYQVQKKNSLRRAGIIEPFIYVAFRSIVDDRTCTLMLRFFYIRNCSNKSYNINSKNSQLMINQIEIKVSNINYANVSI